MRRYGPSGLEGASALTTDMDETERMRQHYAARLRHVADDMERVRAGSLSSHTEFRPAELRAMATALSASPWRPIPPTPTPGVAPFDGKPVDLWCVREWTDEEYGYAEAYGMKPVTAIRLADCFWTSRGWARITDTGMEDLVEGAPCDESGLPPWTPTHYAPLPAPPREDRT